MQSLGVTCSMAGAAGFIFWIDSIHMLLVIDSTGYLLNQVETPPRCGAGGEARAPARRPELLASRIAPQRPFLPRTFGHGQDCGAPGRARRHLQGRPFSFPPYPLVHETGRQP